MEKENRSSRLGINVIWSQQQHLLLMSGHGIFYGSDRGIFTTLEERINGIRDILNNGQLGVSKLGIFAMTNDEYAPMGFNAFTESDGKLAIGDVAVMDYFQYEGSDHIFRGVTAPDRYFDCKDSRERTSGINRNLRAIMQLFNIKVIVYPERVEIKGAIPTQVLDKSAEVKTGTAPIITSPSPGKGESFIRAFLPIVKTCLWRGSPPQYADK